MKKYEEMDSWAYPVKFPDSNRKSLSTCKRFGADTVHINDSYKLRMKTLVYDWLRCESHQNTSC